MIGKRVYAKETYELAEGEYTYIVRERTWYARCPGPGRLIANLGAHTIVEHMDDGTITVTPSIESSDGRGGHRYHGFLERGVWRLA